MRSLMKLLPLAVGALAVIANASTASAQQTSYRPRITKAHQQRAPSPTRGTVTPSRSVSQMREWNRRKTNGSSQRNEAGSLQEQRIRNTAQSRQAAGQARTLKDIREQNRSAAESAARSGGRRIALIAEQRRLAEARSARTTTPKLTDRHLRIADQARRREPGQDYQTQRSSSAQRLSAQRSQNSTAGRSTQQTISQRRLNNRR